MSRAIRLALVSLVMLALVNESALAQRRGIVDVSPGHFRRGFWLEGGIGWGEESYKLAPDGYTETLGKPTLSLGLGGTVNPHLRLGGEVTAWWNQTQLDDGTDITDVTEYLTEILAVARFYPGRDLGLYLKGGAGLGISGTDGEFVEGVSETGFATVLGLGYEIKVSRSVFITPTVNYYFNRFEKRNEPTLYERLWNVGVGVTWQLGR
ncbi:MAG TPA: outer membrane beta-barrel protein [Gemmatimonadales bacterium]